MLEAFNKGGEKGFWRRNLDLSLQAIARAERTVPPGLVAWEYAMLGEKDKAFEWLDKAYDERDGQNITLLKVDPYYRNLRGDPRYSAMLHKMGLPE
jgi:hypothetical protein